MTILQAKAIVALKDVSTKAKREEYLEALQILAASPFRN